MRTPVLGRSARPRSLRPRIERLEVRSLLNGAWAGYAGNAQHTAVSTVASQPLETIRWQTPVDMNPQYSGTTLLVHCGSPAITSSGTLLLPVKTGATGGFQIQARTEATGEFLWSLDTPYALPPHNWVPSYGPTLTSSGALAMPGVGGQVILVDNPDVATGPVSRTVTFFGEANYAANPSAYNSQVFISTPITADNAGNLYFGFTVTGATPLNLKGGLARIAADGTGSFVSAATASGDAAMAKVVTNCAPAISNDGRTVYVAVNNGNFGRGYLLGLDSTTLATTAKAALVDPKTGNASILSDDGTASPLVGPDGDVYYGVLESPFGTTYRGWLLHFDSTLTQAKIPGAFGWDDTPSIVPVSMVPDYDGTSSYLLMVKYNNYAVGPQGDGVNRVAMIDPNEANLDPVSKFLTMEPVRSLAGPTADHEYDDNYAFAVREWCINTAVVDPQTSSVLVNNEDGKLYRWHLPTNTFSEVVVLTAGIGEAYTPTLIGPDGAVFAVNNAILFAVGAAAPVSSPDTYSIPEDGTLDVGGRGVMANDTGGKGMPLSASLIAGPSHGSLTLRPDGSFLYTPTPLFDGKDSFTYRVSDGGLWSAPATVSLTVTPVNHAPVAAPDAYSVGEGQTLSVGARGVLGNDTDVDPGATITAQLVTAPLHGTLTLLANGSFTYRPADGSTSDDAFTYRAIDGEAVSNTVTVSITLVPGSRTPLAVPDTYPVDEDGVLAVFASQGVLANDSVDVPALGLTAQLVSPPAHGTVTVHADGSFLYRPSPDFTGQDRFTYSANSGGASSIAGVTINVSPVNDLPVASGTAIVATQGRLASDDFEVATFSDPDALPSIIDRASIDWGDGSAATQGVVSARDGGYRVTGSHLYDLSGAFLARVTITDQAGGVASAVSSAQVAAIGVAVTGGVSTPGASGPGGVLITNVAAPAIGGTAPAGFRVAAFATSAATGVVSPLGEVTASAGNTFAIVAGALPDGVYDLTFLATNTTPGSSLKIPGSGGRFQIDTAGPRIVGSTIDRAKGTATITIQDVGAGLSPLQGLGAPSFRVTLTNRNKVKVLPAVATSEAIAPGQATTTITLTINRGKKLPKGQIGVSLISAGATDLAGNAMPVSSATRILSLPPGAPTHRLLWTRNRKPARR